MASINEAEKHIVSELDQMAGRLEKVREGIGKVIFGQSEVIDLSLTAILAGGHGLAAQILLILDDSSPSALVVDREIPASAALLHEALASTWPRLSGRVEFAAAQMDDVPITSGDLVVSVHACGALTDVVLARAIAAQARVAVLPCCHDRRACETGGLEGWMDPALAIDATRAARLSAAGYRVRTQTIPSAITPKNRLLIGEPVS